MKTPPETPRPIQGRMQPKEAPPRNGPSRSASFARIAFAYLAALIILFASHAPLTTWASSLAENWQLPPALVAGAIFDAVATVVVFLFSLLLRNASTYDAYWSVAPIALACFWLFPVLESQLESQTAHDVALLRPLTVFALITWWGLRLTWNWARGWTGLDHEDWRYKDLRRQTGAAYPLVNLFGIHFFPTVQVFLGMVPAYFALTAAAPVSWLDAVALLVTASAILIEQIADRQLLAFRREKAARPSEGTHSSENTRSPKDGGQVLHTGLWAWSRHPNYFGEAFFWWGLAIFGFAATGIAFSFVGAFAITLMFLVVSIPMIEKRHRGRRPTYEAQAARTKFFLWPPKK